MELRALLNISSQIATLISSLGTQSFIYGIQQNFYKGSSLWLKKNFSPVEGY